MNIAHFLKSRGVSYDVLPHPATFDAPRMAEALGISGRFIAKTVLLRADGGYAYLVVVLPATERVDLEKVSQSLGRSRVDVATEADVWEHCPDCEFGVLPPFGSQYGMLTLVDQRLTAYPDFIFEGNQHSLAIRMSWKDFHDIENPLTGDFCQVQESLVGAA